MRLRIPQGRPIPDSAESKRGERTSLTAFLIVTILIASIGYCYYISFKTAEETLYSALCPVHKEILDRFDKVRDRAIYVTTQVVRDDPNKTIRFERTKAAEFLSFLCIFSITASENVNDTVIIDVRDENGTIITTNITKISLRANIPKLVSILIPIFNELGNEVEEFRINVTTRDEEIAIFGIKPIYAIKEILGIIPKKEVKYEVKKGSELWKILEEKKFIKDKEDPTELADLWSWAREKLTYKEEIGDYAQTADQTLKRGGGDCEDLAIFVATALEYYGFTSEDVRIVYANIYNREFKRISGHAFTKVKIGGKWWVIDLASDMGPLPYDVYLDRVNKILAMSKK
ncbi:hypothetical protein DRN86_01445, partial [Candidatus Geothermarchaeota archaeon]